MRESGNDFLAQAVEVLHSHDVENFLIIAENPESKRTPEHGIRAVFGGKRGVIVAMLVEVFKRKEGSLSYVLDAFLSLGHLDKIGQEGELARVLEQLKEG